MIRSRTGLHIVFRRCEAKCFDKAPEIGIVMNGE